MKKTLPTSVQAQETRSRTAKVKTFPEPESIPLPLGDLQLRQPLKIKWLSSGKPILEGLTEQPQIDISLSHDEQVCLCVAGYGNQGCDIAPIVQRRREDWTALLSLEREPLLRQILSTGSDTVNQAGTRIWAAVEALRKATNSQEIRLALKGQMGNGVLFEGTTPNHFLHILTFPVKLTRGPEKIVAVVVTVP